LELARKTGKESLTFIKGEMPIDCDECPVKPNCAHRLFVGDISELVDDDFIELACYGAFIKFLFSED